MFLHVFYLFNPFQSCSIFFNPFHWFPLAEVFLMPLVDEKMHRMGCPARSEQPWLPRCSALRISMLGTSLNICWIPGKPEETSKQDDQHLFGHSRVQGTDILLFFVTPEVWWSWSLPSSRFIKRSSTTTVRWLLRYKGHTVILYV